MKHFFPMLETEKTEEIAPCTENIIYKYGFEKTISILDKMPRKGITAAILIISKKAVTQESENIAIKRTFSRLSKKLHIRFKIAIDIKVLFFKISPNKL